MSRVRPFAAGLGILAAMASIAATCPGRGAGSMSTEPLSVKLLAEPRDLSMSTRGEFQVGISATNRGAATLEPELERARLLVNGEDSLAWSDAILNGHREASWFELPPGESVSMSWGSMGGIFFPGPGAYTLKLTLRELDIAPVVVHVRP
jgi:hypothetical protein